MEENPEDETAVPDVTDTLQQALDEAAASPDFQHMFQAVTPATHATFSPDRAQPTLVEAQPSEAAHFNGYTPGRGVLSAVRIDSPRRRMKRATFSRS